MIDYNNIYDLLDLLYNFVYKDKYSKDYIFEPLNIKNITLDDLIKGEDFNYHYVINNTIDNKTNFKIMDTFEDKIILKKYSKNFPMTLVIQPNKLINSVSITDIYYELAMNQITSEFVILDQVPFYLLNVCNFNLSYNKLKLNSEFDELISKTYPKIKENDYFCISVYEHYSSYDTLRNFIKNEMTEKDMKNIVFQLIFSYAYMIYKLGNYRHNDLTIDSFLVEKFKEPMDLMLVIGENKKFELKTNFVCKMFNYRKSQISGMDNNISCIMDNPTFDIYTLLKSLYESKEDFKNIIKHIMPIEIIKKEFNSESLFVSEISDIINPLEFLIKNNFFDTIIDMPPKRITAGKNKRSKASKKSKPSRNSKKVNKKVSKLISKQIKELVGGTEIEDNMSSVRMPKFLKNLEKKRRGGKKDSDSKSSKSSKSSSSSTESDDESLSTDVSETSEEEIVTGDDSPTGKDQSESPEHDGDTSEIPSDNSYLKTVDRKEIKDLKNRIKEIKNKYKGGKKNKKHSKKESKMGNYADVMNSYFGEAPSMGGINSQPPMPPNMAANPMAGPPMQGNPMAGHPMMGNPMAGPPMSGNPMEQMSPMGPPMAPPMANQYNQQDSLTDLSFGSVAAPMNGMNNFNNMEMSLNSLSLNSSMPPQMPNNQFNPYQMMGGNADQSVKKNFFF